MRAWPRGLDHEFDALEDVAGTLLGGVGAGLAVERVGSAAADERPCKTVDGKITIEDLHATIYRAMGISPKLSYEIEKRPFYVTRDGVGVPRAELFARSI